MEQLNKVLESSWIARSGLQMLVMGLTLVAATTIGRAVFFGDYNVIGFFVTGLMMTAAGSIALNVGLILHVVKEKNTKESS